jgi:Response regulator receiver domain
MRILLAEDSPIYQKLIGDYLNQWGFEIALARDGTEACELLKAPGAPTMALLDWVLPNMLVTLPSCFKGLTWLFTRPKRMVEIGLKPLFVRSPILSRLGFILGLVTDGSSH